MTVKTGLPGRGISKLGLLVGALTVATAQIAGSGAAHAQPQRDWLDELVGDCPAVFTLAVQGTGESSPDAPVKVDTGMLSNVLGPALEGARTLGGSLDRAYVPYPAGFGGAVPGGKESYVASMEQAEGNLEAAAQRVVADCPAAKLSILGFSQGAHSASIFLEKVGKGDGVVSADKIAAAALFGSPTRAAGSSIFPGTTADHPKPAPGTKGTKVAALPAVSATGPAGAGIGPQADIAENYGSLSGRVASLCQPGDLACDAPANAPIARAVTNVAGQAELGGDPFRAVQSIGLALASTSFGVAVDVVNEDVSIPKNSIENLSIAPKKTISERIAAASDPRATPPTGQEALAALTKVGLVAVNAVVSVAKKVITPDTIAAVAAAGLSNPVAAFGVIAAKTAKAVIDLVPPATVQRVTRQTFDVVKNEITANTDLFDLAALTSYTNTVAAHGSYRSAPTTAAGESATQFVADWLAAAASDVGDSTDSKQSSSSTPSTSAVSGSSATSPTSTSRTTTTTPSSTSVTTTSRTPSTTTSPAQPSVSAN